MMTSPKVIIFLNLEKDDISFRQNVLALFLQDNLLSEVLKTAFRFQQILCKREDASFQRSLFLIKKRNTYESNNKMTNFTNRRRYMERQICAGGRHGISDSH